MKEKPKGYGTETAPNGEKLYRHKVKRNGGYVVIKKNLKELTELLKPNTKAAVK